MPERVGRTGRVPVLLLLVLLLVLGAFGLLVIALVTDEARWAWGSVATSAVAGLSLATDWIARPKITTVEPAVPADPPVHGDTSQEFERDTPEAPAVERADTSTRRTAVPEPGVPSSGLGQPVDPI